MKKIIILLLTSILLVWCWKIAQENREEKNISNTKTMNETNLKNAYFAWWCFWCMEGIFESQDWVKEARTGYIGWTKQTATYDQVSTWLTKHREWVKMY